MDDGWMDRIYILTSSTHTFCKYTVSSCYGLGSRKDWVFVAVQRYMIIKINNE